MVSLYQASILLLFNTTGSLSLSEISEARIYSTLDAPH